MSKIFSAAPILAAFALAANVHALSTNDIQIWAGSGTNHAALVITWSSPEFLNYTTVPAPVANKTLVWGYQFNGTATATEMFNAVLAADHRLYAVGYVDPFYGAGIEGLGYNLSASGYGVSDGTTTDTASAFLNGFLNDPNLNVDAAYPLNPGDLYWSGFDGPYWILWNELGDNGGFSASPNRGTNAYASFDMDTFAWTQGQWESSFSGLSFLPLQDGSWIGLTISAAGYDTNSADPAAIAFNNDEQAPASPDGTYVAYVCNTNDFVTQVIDSTNVYSNPPYNLPAAMLGRPTLDFIDSSEGNITNRTSIIDDPFNVVPGGSDIITEISKGGEVTVMMGRKVCHNPGNPYGIDLIVYGNSFFSASGTGGFVSDASDLNTATLSGLVAHSATISVSPDNTNWATLGSVVLFPDNAFRWDEPNQSWTAELMNPTKPLDPSITTASLSGLTAAGALDQFIGAAGGTGFSLAGSGFSWIQYVRIQPSPNTYTVIDAIAAVDPAVEGDTLSLAPGDIASGVTNLSFENPATPSQTLISLDFASLSETAKVSTVALSDFSPFAPVPGVVENACQITVAPVSGTPPVALTANVTLSAGNYAGDGTDLRVLQWNGTNWSFPAFTYNAAANQVGLTGLTNLSAFVVSQLSPQVSIQTGVSGFSYQFTPFPNVTYALQRSTDLRNWSIVNSIVPTSTQPVALQDPAPPPVQAFYRLKATP